MPTYNERETIAGLIAWLLACTPGLRVLVVDDGSPDGTGDIVKDLSSEDPRVHLLSRDEKSGLGSAYRAGYGDDSVNSADIVCQMDADLSHAPAQLRDLIAAVVDGADVAIGSRYVPGGEVHNWAFHRRVLSRAANGFVRLATGCRVNDSTSGFRAYTASALASIGVAETRSNGYAFQIEMSLRALEAGLDVREVPITFIERVHGQSKLAGSVTSEAFWSVLRWGWRLRRGVPL